MKTTLALLPLLAAAAGAAWGQQVYKSVDPQGRVIYTDRPVEGAEPVDLPPVTTIPALKAPEKAKAPAARGGGVPARPEGIERRAWERQLKITEAEARLEAARKELAEQEAIRLGDERHNYQKYLDRVQRYRDEVARREQELEALRQEPLR
jgi:hypothetical protein